MSTTTNGQPPILDAPLASTSWPADCLLCHVRPRQSGRTPSYCQETKTISPFGSVSRDSAQRKHNSRMVPPQVSICCSRGRQGIGRTSHHRL